MNGLKRYLTSPEKFAHASGKVLFYETMKEGTAYLFYEKLRGDFPGASSRRGSPLAEAALQREEFLKLVESSYFHNLTHNLLMIDTFLKNYGEILSGIPVILLKGISLLGSVYEDPGLRHLGDIDILIRPEDYPAARQKLERAGYEFNDTLKAVTDSRSFHSVMCRERNAAPEQPFIHLHWHWLNTMLPVWMCASSIDLNKIWKDAEPYEGAPGIFRLSAVHQIIYYGYHHLKHSFDRLIRLHDIDRTIRYYEARFSWEELLEETADFGLSRHLYFPLYAAKTILESPVPDNVLKSLCPGDLTGMERRILACLSNAGKPVYAHFAVYLSMQQGWLNKIKFILLTLFPFHESRPRPGYLFIRIGKGSLRLWQFLRSLYFDRTVGKVES